MESNVPIDKPMLEDEAFAISDQVLPILRLPDPCVVSIKMNEKYVFLFVGPRDFQWDRKTGKLIGTGCGCTPDFGCAAEEVEG